MADNELPASEHDDRGAGPATKTDPVIQDSTGAPVSKGEDPATENTPIAGDAGNCLLYTSPSPRD